MNRHLEGLNPEQKNAVEQTSGPLMIIAGAGTGKTRVITHRIVHLITQGIEPGSILAVTFTNKAAQEMKSRVESLLKEHAPHLYSIASIRPFMSTFHGLGVKILKENARLTERQKYFSIFDRDDSLSLIKQTLKELDIDPKRYSPGLLLSSISKQKGEGVSAESFYEHAGDFFSKMIASVWQRYEEKLRKEQAFDFDDLLLQTVLLFEKHPDIAKGYRDLWRHIHVDEYQDTNIIQYRLIQLLAGPERNICVVGDHDQCIYTWRSADMRNMKRFEEAFPDVKIVTLEENYRSTQHILTAANQSIRLNTHRKEKELFTKGPEGERLKLYSAIDGADEARYVAEKAEEYIRQGIPAGEIAVLFRANFLSRVLEEAFLAAKIPYQIVGTRFFERKEVKDMLSYIHASLNEAGATHLTRIINVPTRGIGKATLLKVLAGGERELPAGMQRKVADFKMLLQRIRETAIREKPSETIKYILRESGLEKELKNGTDDEQERLANIKELVSLASRYDGFPPEEGILMLLEEASLISDQDTLKATEETVKLMTIHAAKGLEFENVFIVGLEEGLFPNERSEMRETPEEREEERRLFYVALTRAKKIAHLSYAHIRTIFGSATVNIPSRFISDIDEKLIEDITPQDEWVPGKKGLLDIDF